MVVDGHLHAPAPVCLGKNVSTMEAGLTHSGLVVVDKTKITLLCWDLDPTSFRL